MKKFKLTVEIEYKSVRPGLIEAISERRNIPNNEVAAVLMYNVITAQQLASITGKNSATITSYLRRMVKSDGTIYSRLTRCYPFYQPGKKRGFVFILRDFLCERFIEESLM